MPSLYGSTPRARRLLAQIVTPLSQLPALTSTFGRLSEVGHDVIYGCQRLRFAQKLWDAGVKTAPVPNPG